VQLPEADAQPHAALVDSVDLLGVGEAPPARAVAGVDHEPVEDVLLRGGEDVLDLPDLRARGVVHRRAALEHQVGDGGPEIHAPTLYPA
jgi:hypothetical protein